MLRVVTHLRPKQAGFTLLEVLISLALFALLSALLFRTFGDQTNLQSRLSEQQERWAEELKVWQLIERDLTQLAPRPARDVMGDRQAALKFGNGSTLSFSSFSWYTGQFTDASRLLRVNYRLDQDKQFLWRESWVHPDRVASSVKQQQLLMEGVSNISIRALTKEGQWLPYWPPPESPLEAMPKALELNITSEDYGKITRLFGVPEGARE